MTTDGDKTHVDFFGRTKNRTFAAQHGFTVKEERGLWRIYHDGAQIAMCTLESAAVEVAYALAMLEAGARLPG